MTNSEPTPGSASLEELKAYWRMPSKRAARDLAVKLGVRRIAGEYPWLSIWACEHLAPPAAKHWDDLKRPHLTSADMAKVLGSSSRTACRRDHHKPDSEFPNLVRLRKKPKLWRRVQVYAWAAGMPVPVYTTIPKRPRSINPKFSPKTVSLESFEGFNPFEFTQSSDTKDN
jgi:hypothetical protein